MATDNPKNYPKFEAFDNTDLVKIYSRKNKFAPAVIPLGDLKNQIIQNSGGSTFENKTFYLNAAGTDITGSDLGITLEVSGNNPVIRIPTVKTLKLLHILVSDASTLNCSQGMSNGPSSGGFLNTCITTLNKDASHSFGYTDTSSCVDIYEDANQNNGRFAEVTTITPTYFEITFSKAGASMDITGQMYLIEG